MSIFEIYFWSTASWLSIQALPLLLSPTVIVTMLANESRKPTDLEAYFCRSSAFTLLFTAVLILILTNSIPLTASSLEKEEARTSSLSPYASAIITVTSTFHILSAIYAYTSYVSTSQTAFALSLVGYGGLSVLGLWCLMFGGGSHISKRTGADKRTSGFPFKNDVAREKRKK